MRIGVRAAKRISFGLRRNQAERVKNELSGISSDIPFFRRGMRGFAGFKQDISV